MSDVPQTRCDFNASDLILHLDLELPADTEAISPVVEKSYWAPPSPRLALTPSMTGAGEPVGSSRSTSKAGTRSGWRTIGGS